MKEPPSSSLLLKCLVVSATLHVTFLATFFAKPLYFNPALSTFLGKTPPTLLKESPLTTLEKEAALEEAMRHFVVLSSTVSPPAEGHLSIPQPTSATPVEKKPIHYDHSLQLPEQQQPVTSVVLPTTPLQLPPDPITEIPIGHSFSLQPVLEAPTPFPGTPLEIFNIPSLNVASTPLLDESIQLQFFPLHENEPTPQLPSFATPPSPTTPLTDAHLLSESPTLTDTSLLIPEVAAHSTPLLPSSPSIQEQRALDSLPNYGVPELSALDWNDLFSVDVKTYPHEKEGYLFSVTFTPKEDLSQHRLKQTYYFLIDRSNSIEKHRYQTFKKAVHRALSSLNEGDSFNILILDSKVTRLSEKPLQFNKSTLRVAAAFLEKEPHGNYGAATDIYTALCKLLPLQLQKEEAHTAILISDGDSKLKPDQQRQMIHAWLETNQGTVSLYTAAVGQNNNLTSLDLLSALSRGSLVYADTHTSLPRKLAKLILSLKAPIAKEMAFSIFPSDPTAHIQLYPPSARLPYLFSNQPFTLVGTIDKLSDFCLLLQGKNKERVLSIKKTISFTEAKPGNRLLSKEWNTAQAHLFYERYLQEGKQAFLEEAQNLLSHDAAHPRR